MKSVDPATCCFLTSCKDQPVHLRDGFTGQLRASYRSYNQMDEISSAYSLTFDASGDHVICGHDGRIDMFDTNRPGRDSQILCSWIKKSKEGIPEIVSCFATSHSCPSLVACGSYAKCCGLIDLNARKRERVVGMLCDPLARFPGVTHVLYSRDGWQLFAGARKSNEILCWDLRTMSNEPLYRLHRGGPGNEETTNQRLEFDIDISGKHLVSGSQHGEIYVYDLDGDGTTPTTPFPKHKDTVNGVSFHPTLPIVAFSTGQRKFSIDMGPDHDHPPSPLPQSHQLHKHLTYDNLVSIWRCWPKSPPPPQPEYGIASMETCNK